MELRKLEYFEAVARLNSFTKAAEELRISQPSISNAIKHLEEELGLTLFIRNKRHVELTYEGEVFLAKVQNILSNVSATVEEMQEFANNRQLTLNIGIAPNSGSFLYKIMYKENWHNSYDVKFKVLEFGSYGILEAIKNDQVDLGYIVLDNDTEQDFNSIQIKRDQIQLLVNKNHVLASYDKVPVTKLNHLNIIHYPKHSFISRKIDQLANDYNLKFNIIAMPQQMLTIYDLVQQDVGTCFILGSTYKNLANTENLVSMPLDPPIYYNTGFVYKKDKKITKAAKLLITYVNNQQN